MKNPSARSDLPPIRTFSRWSKRLPNDTVLFYGCWLHWVVRTHDLRKQNRNQAWSRMEVSFFWLVIIVPKDVVQVDGRTVSKILAQLWTLCVTKLTIHARSDHRHYSTKSITNVYQLLSDQTWGTLQESTSFTTHPSKNLWLGRL